MFWRKKRTLNDFKEEIDSHLAHEADQVEEDGEARANAEAAARRSFGNVQHAKEEFCGFDRWPLWDQFVRDVRQAIRVFWRRPGFSAVIVLTLGLGIGANTAIFSVVDAVLLRQMPYKDPDRLAMLWSDDAAHDIHEGRVALLNFTDWQGRSQAFESMTLFGAQTFLLGGSDGPPERMRSARVSANFFPLLGVAPRLGRVFTPEEEQQGAAVVVLSYGLWQRLGASTAVLGSDLTMDNQKRRVIGVMPASFHFPFDDTQVWEPITAHPYWRARDQASPRSFAVWFVLGRLRSGIGWEQAQTEMSGIAAQIEGENPDGKVPPNIRVVPLHTQATGRLRLSLSLLFGSVFLMLLIACANVANLLLARGSAREREFVMRRALGASRLRLGAQLMTESLVLAGAGGLLGVGLAAVALKSLIALSPRDIPRMDGAHIDAKAMCFALVLCVFASSMAAMWPAIRAGGTSAGSRQWKTLGDRKIQNLLTAGEFAIALILLAGAGLMIRSFERLQGVDPGFDPEKLIVMRIDLHVGKTAAQQAAYFLEAIEQARAFPGVKSAGAISEFLRSDPEDSVEVEGRPVQQPGPCEDSIAGPVFETARIPLKRGRFFSDEDRRNSPPVAIINETMARSYWPNEDPIGKRFRYPDQQNGWITVVGVTGDMHRQGLERQVVPQVFVPESQRTDDMMDVIVRTSSAPAAMQAALQTKIQGLDRSVARFKVATIEEQMVEETAQRRFQTTLIGLFSAIALLLSATGIYGLMNYFVTQRVNEIGVRMALGAGYQNVLGLVLRQGLGWAGVGIAAGILGALGLTRLFSSLLFSINPTDTVTFVAAPVILVCVAALACWVPARRAARIDPVAALRQE